MSGTTVKGSPFDIKELTVADLDHAFVIEFNKAIVENLKNGGMSDADLIAKFWQIYGAKATQRFFIDKLCCHTENNGEAMAADLLLWLSFGHGNGWAGREPTKVPSIKDININSLNWSQWIDYYIAQYVPDWDPLSLPFKACVITSFRSNNHDKERVLDFSQDRSSFEYYGYKADKYPDLKVRGGDCMRHATMHQLYGDLLDGIKQVTAPCKGKCNESSSYHFVVAVSGITYQMFDVKHPAWYSAQGKFYDYESISLGGDGNRIVLGREHAIPGNYNNCSIAVAAIEDRKFTKDCYYGTLQLANAATLFKTLVLEKMYGGMDYLKSRKIHLLSEGYVNPVHSHINYRIGAFSILSLGSSDSPARWDGAGDRANNVVFKYSKESPVSDIRVADLRYGIRAIGMPVTITGDDKKDSVYDLELARCCWQLKAQLLGVAFHKACTHKSEIVYIPDDPDMNLDWQVVGYYILEHRLSKLYGRADLANHYTMYRQK